MPSIPPLLGGKVWCCWLTHPLRMANRLMAALADADQVALTLPFRIRVVNIQSQIRPALHMIDMVDQLCTTISALGFTDLALMVI